MTNDVVNVTHVTSLVVLDHDVLVSYMSIAPYQVTVIEAMMILILMVIVTHI